LEIGADPNIQNLLGLTPLHLAARFGHIYIAKLLIVNAADVNIRDFNGYNASYWAE